MEKFERTMYDYYYPDTYADKSAYSPLYYEDMDIIYNRNKQNNT